MSKKIYVNIPDSLIKDLNYFSHYFGLSYSAFIKLSLCICIFDLKKELYEKKY